MIHHQVREKLRVTPKILRVLDSPTFIDFLGLARQNNYYPEEFDCGWDGYIHYIIKEMYGNNEKYGLFVMYQDKDPIGYMILKAPDYLKHSMSMFDMFILPEQQSKKLILLFVDLAFDVCREVGVRRLTWMSPSLPREYWMGLGDIMGVRIKEATEYSIDFEESTNEDLHQSGLRPGDPRATQ